MAGIRRNYPSSICRKLVADPESLVIKTIDWMGILVSSNFCAVITGPIVLVRRWSANRSKDL